MEVGMFFTFPKDFRNRELSPQVTTRLAWGEKLMISYVTIEANAPVPPLHSHPNEQMGMVLEGEVGLTVGDETRRLKKGDAFRVPPNVRHGLAYTSEKQAIVLDIFSPAREEFKT
jgi:quercetin dioxygenase-like cupin family protein